MDRLPHDGVTHDATGSAPGAAQADCWKSPVQFPLETAAQTAPAVAHSLHRGDADSRMAQLARAIEQEIIPRLMLAHRAAQECPDLPALAGETVSRQDVLDFAKLVLSQDDALAISCVHAMCARGISIERIYLDLLAPAARYLGDLWNEDLCDFTEVTVGLGRLQRVLRELSPEFGHLVEHPANGRRVLLLPSPGEQHTFGLVMVGEFFRRAGWDVAGGPWEAGEEAVDLVGAEWFDVVGFSLGAEIHLDALRDCIRAVRSAACNPALAIMVGGPMFSEHPEYVAQIGADAMAADGRMAPLLAERLVAQHVRRC